jgi:hypothetical protein
MYVLYMHHLGNIRGKSRSVLSEFRGKIHHLSFLVLLRKVKVVESGKAVRLPADQTAHADPRNDLHPIKGPFQTLNPSRKRQDIEEEGSKPSFISFMIRGIPLDLRDTSNLEDEQSDARGSLSFLIRGGYGLHS